MPELESVSDNFEKIDADTLKVTYTETKTSLLKALTDITEKRNKELLKITQKYNPKIEKIKGRLAILNVGEEEEEEEEKEISKG
jgi:hypothetical protein